jgi:hypothetical protein
MNLEFEGYNPFDSEQDTSLFVSQVLSDPLASQTPAAHLDFVNTFASAPNGNNSLVTQLASATPSKLSVKAGKLSGGMGSTRRTAPFSAKELFEVLQAALEVRIFEAKFGERKNTEIAMGDMVRGHGIAGSNGLFKTRMLEMLTWHEVRVSTCSCRVMELNS